MLSDLFFSFFVKKIQCAPNDGRAGCRAGCAPSTGAHGDCPPPPRGVTGGRGRAVSAEDRWGDRDGASERDSERTPRSPHSGPAPPRTHATHRPGSGRRSSSSGMEGEGCGHGVRAGPPSRRNRVFSHQPTLVSSPHPASFSLLCTGARRPWRAGAPTNSEARGWTPPSLVWPPPPPPPPPPPWPGLAWPGLAPGGGSGGSGRGRLPCRPEMGPPRPTRGRACVSTGAACWPGGLRTALEGRSGGGHARAAWRGEGKGGEAGEVEVEAAGGRAVALPPAAGRPPGSPCRFPPVLPDGRDAGAGEATVRAWSGRAGRREQGPPTRPLPRVPPTHPHTHPSTPPPTSPPVDLVAGSGVPGWRGWPGAAVRACCRLGMRH